MIHKETLSFLKDLKSNNSREWFSENKKRYEFAKDNTLALTEELIGSVPIMDEAFLESFLEPRNCITRLNRDLRFTKDKTPYKTDYYIVLNKNGKNSCLAFYYVHIEPGNCFAGGGVWNPQNEQLEKIRQEIDWVFRVLYDSVTPYTFLEYAAITNTDTKLRWSCS